MAQRLTINESKGARNDDSVYDKLKQLSEKSTYPEVIDLLGKPSDVGGSGTVILIYQLRKKGREAAIRVNGVGSGSKVISVIVVEEGKPVEYIVGKAPAKET